jgi:error-prone DNA polymerase
VTAFSEFGFPKSHAAAFGLLAYQSAWLRHYHPLEYYVALFNNQPMGFYSLDALGRDARRNGIRTLLPDVNRSDVACTAEGEDLRIGLGFVREWGTEVAEEVVAERERGGPFRSLADFLRRTPATLKRPAVENLVWVGGFEGFGLTRRELLWQAGLWLGPESDDERSGGRHDHAQTELALDDPYAGLAFPDLGDTDRMVAEYRMLRFSTELHPLSLLKGQLPSGTITSDRLPHLRQHATVRIAGLVTARQRPGTAKGFVFVLMEDEAGPVNVIVKPDIYARDRSAVRLEPFLAVKGRLQKDGASLNVIAHQVRALRVPGAPVRRSGLSRSAYGNATGGGVAREGSADVDGLYASLPGTMEYWMDPDRSGPTPFRYLTALRQSPPGIKSFG